MTITPRALVSLAIAIFMASFLVMAFDFSAKAALLPIMVTSAILVMALIQLLGDLFPALRQKMPFLEQQSLLANDKTTSVSDDVRKVLQDGHASEMEKQVETDEETPGYWKIVVVCVLAMAGLLAVLMYVPYWLAVPLFLFVVLVFVGRQNLKISFAIAAVMGVAMFGLFDLILNARI